MAKAKPEENQKPGAQEDGEKAEQQNVEGEILSVEKLMDEESAQEEKANDPGQPESMSTVDIGKYKVKRFKYDLACIMGGKIIAAVSWKDENQNETEKIGLVVEVENRQGPIEHFTIWPVQSLEDLKAPVTYIEINKTELA